VFGDADLSVFFADFGVPVFFGSQGPVKGIFDRPMQIKLADDGFGGTETGMPEVRLPYNAFSPMPTEGDVITVDGTQYSVSEKTREGDGAVVCHSLKAVGL
jgi:hypothetical protein